MTLIRRLPVVLLAAAACDYIAYDLGAQGRAPTRPVEVEPGARDGGTNPGRGDGGGTAQPDGGGAQLEDESDAGDYGAAAHAVPAWSMPDSPTRRCAESYQDATADAGLRWGPCRVSGQVWLDDQDGMQEVNKPTYDWESAPGAVTDLVTNLQWQAEVDTARARTWQEARSYCFQLVLAGFRDWRLPTRVELVSLLDLGRDPPFIEPTAFPDTPAERFWTSSPAPSDQAWFVDFGGSDFEYEGLVGAGPKTRGSLARCVR